jgi:S-formylglutathione hydrolase FrmB
LLGVALPGKTHFVFYATIAKEVLMAVFQINFFPQTLRRKMSLTAVIPADTPAEPGLSLPEVFKTVFLLHGLSGNHTDWLFNAPLPELAARFGLALIMPEGETSFYLNDEARGALFEDFICDELPAFCRRVFPLSSRREDTAIAGLSMGGFGAIHSAFAHPEVFGSVIALSSALITDAVSRLQEGQGNEVAPYSYYRHVFGPLEKLPGSHSDPKALARELAGKPELWPRLYMACGTEDILIEENRDFHRYLGELGFPHGYVEDQGAHDWGFWRPYLAAGLEWLTARP